MFEALANWKWPNGEMGPGIFSWYHIMWLVICISLCVLFAHIGRKPHDKKKDDLIILVLGIILLTIEILKQLMYVVGHYKYYRMDILPFAICSTPLYFSLVGSLVKNEKVKEVCYKYISFFGLVGGIAFMILPDSLKTNFIYISIQTMLWHTIIVLMGVYLIAARGYGKNIVKDIIHPFIAFCGCVVLAFAMNEIAYYAILKPAETPTITVDRENGAHTKSSYGFYDGENYYYLKEENGTLVLSDTYKDCRNFSLSNAQNDNFLLTIGESKFISMSKEDNQPVKLLVTDETPTTYWKYVVANDNSTILCTEINGENYFISMNKETKKIFPELSSNHNSEENLRSDFISVKFEREGDSANYFFISSHYEMVTFPFRTWLLENIPYPICLLMFVSAYMGISCLVWTGTHYISPLVDRKYQSTSI